MHSLIRLISVLVCAALFAPIASGQQDANIERGFAPEKLYQFENVDSINTFNGNLSLTIPIGQTFRVGTLSWGLKVTYNSKIWDLYSDSQGVPFAELSPNDNAGVGWRLSLGQLTHSPINSPNAWVYTSEDGAEHRFYSTLHLSETAVSGYWYTRDNSYLRLKRLSQNEYEVEAGDGTVRKFRRDASSPFQMVELRDRFNNKVTVDYSTTPVTWKISDGHRQVWVEFTTIANRQVVNTVQVKTHPQLTTVATYTFGYADRVIHESCQDRLASNGTTRRVPLLTSVTLPGGAGKFAMDGADDYYTQCTGDVADLPGVIHRLTLPTLGKVEWTYQTHQYPSRGIIIPQSPSLESTITLGVRTRTVVDANGECAELGGTNCTWTYVATQSGQHPNTERAVTLTYPTGHRTVFHFSTTVARPTSANWNGWQYGLPFKPSAPDDSGNYFLSQEIFDKNGNKKRSIYVAYERDVIPSGNQPQNWYNSNRRLVGEKTVFEDDELNGVPISSTVSYSEFDGLGQYRRRVTGGTFGAGDLRTEFTNFNPGQGNFVIDTDTNTQTSSYTPLPITSPWILRTSTETSVVEGSSKLKTQTCYEAATGFLAWTRVFQDGTSQQSNDVLTRFTRDTDSAGDIAAEEYYGGDSTVLLNTSQNSTCTLSSLPNHDYRIVHTYQAGSRRTSQYTDVNGNPLTFYTLNLIIDNTTGLPTSSTDQSGIVTSYVYDALGRLTWIKPASGHGAYVQYEYKKALAGTPAKVVMTQRLNGDEDGTSLTESEVEYDAFGRVASEREKLPTGQWTTVNTRYNSMGWIFDVSERMVTPNKATQYLNYDPFGRAGTIRPPDSTGAHDITLEYAGDRKVLRTLKVATNRNPNTGVISETEQTTAEIYDRQGRLHRVDEPSLSGAPVTETIYGYDAGGRLTSVTMRPRGGATAQRRTFGYDGRGFLRWENHPEKTANVSGSANDIDYLSHDARGHVRRRIEGVHDITFAYDRAERPTLSRETGSGFVDCVNNGGRRCLKTFTYDTSNTANNWKNGKIVTATRYNHVVLGGSPMTVQVAETYTYGGKGARPSRRVTQTSVNGSPTEAFTQGWTYDDLGAVTSIEYPTCTRVCNVPAVTARTVNYEYTFGHLTSVPGYTLATATHGITYHGNGTVNKVFHSNSVTDTFVADPNGMRRPESISTAKGATVLWRSGSYVYDGSGNTVKIGPAWFTYDERSRVKTGAVFTGPNPGGAGILRSQNYSYDPYANITDISGSAMPTSTSTNRLTGGGYDAAGNLTSWNGAAFKYDPFNLMWNMKSGSEDWLYIYTADDERIWSFRVGGFHRWTIRGNGNQVVRELTNSAAGWAIDTDYIYRGSSLLATENPNAGSRRHYHLDHLGTPRLITNSAGVQVAFHTYFPFGEEATAFNQDTARMKFTGHERDLGDVGTSADDLDYMHARHFSPSLGRFLSVDRVAAEPTEPQTWNRYAYAANRPLALVDPDGMKGIPKTPVWVNVDENGTTSAGARLGIVTFELGTSGWQKVGTTEEGNDIYQTVEEYELKLGFGKLMVGVEIERTRISELVNTFPKATRKAPDGTHPLEQQIHPGEAWIDDWDFIFGGKPLGSSGPTVTVDPADGEVRASQQVGPVKVGMSSPPTANRKTRPGGPPTVEQMKDRLREELRLRKAARHPPRSTRSNGM
jgi:RHS repeat-associated protein